MLQSKKKLAKLKDLEEQFEQNQDELKKNKERIGNAINKALELGGDIADQLIDAMKL